MPQTIASPRPDLSEIEVSPVGQRQSVDGSIPSPQEAGSPSDSNVGAGNEPKGTSYWLDKRRSDLMSEPKDDSWAYYMEQTILQFLASHPAMSEFDVSYIECRTTTCQIQVVGFDASTGPTWQRIMYDFGQQVPDQFYQSGWSGFELDGRAVFVQTLKRNQQTP